MNLGKLMLLVQNVPDTRRKSGNFRHKLSDIIVIAICATVCGSPGPNGMETFGLELQKYFKRFLELPYGIPSADTFERILAKVCPDEFQKYVSQAQNLIHEKWKNINIDGKTMRGSGNNKHDPYHIVSAWCKEKSMTLCQVATDEKSNEITAIPKLLDLINIKGDIVTIDAMGCQREIAKKITLKKADYVLAVKGNQGTLHDLIKDYYETTSDKTVHTEHSKSRGRIEKREYCLCNDVKWLDDGKWANLQGIGMVKSTVTQKEKVTTATRYYITSLKDGTKFAESVRSHWSIENNLHWTLDVLFGEDKHHAKKDNLPKNLNILRKIALTLLHGLEVKKKNASLKMKMLSCSLNPEEYLDKLFGRQAA